MTTSSIVDVLPEPVRERLREVSVRPSAASGSHVVYWMHHAVRGHENPALDAAIVAARHLGLPLLVYQGLGGDHRFNSDRHHSFILEGARDARAELAARGVTHVLWLGGQSDEPSPLVELGRRAALVVTEDFPAPPFPRWVESLDARIDAGVWAVDTACVVPMRLVGRPFDRAFRFREAIRDLLGERLERPWSEQSEIPDAFDCSKLMFDDVDFETESIREMVARCPIDHTVGPVPHTRGGAIAGYQRWQYFRNSRLRDYAAHRNDAAADGVSRLSPYLHHGHVSPLRVARETAAVGGKGAQKFLDELIVWRELAHNLCFHRHREVESLAVLPQWAQDTLADHATDPRDVLSWETLARGTTGDRLWDLCQASLLRHGELHNNVRMTWGKAILGWAASPERALELLIDLNHRFALDGSDPSSYCGLLWCLGLFDRPFTPERPVMGRVRSRPTAVHARRLDLDRYARRVLEPATERPLRVGVVGAGISGLACARTLADHGHEVRVFEKARGVGGRMATRRSDVGPFDHGAQYFTVRSSRFRRCVDAWLEHGLVARWDGTIAVLAGGAPQPKSGNPERLVAVPGMSALCRHLAADLDVAFETKVSGLETVEGQWRLVSELGRELGVFDAVVVSAPAPQSAALLASASPGMAARSASVDMSPCWAAMIAFAQPLDLGFDGAFVSDSPLSWVARNASKPDRPAAETWVLHGSPEWSREHLELEPAEAGRQLLEAFREAAGHDRAQPTHLDVHRWRFAQPEPLAEPCLFDADRRLVACGDWCDGPRVEGAFLSGCAAAGRLLAMRPNSTQGASAGNR